MMNDVWYISYYSWSISRGFRARRIDVARCGLCTSHYHILKTPHNMLNEAVIRKTMCSLFIIIPGNQYLLRGMLSLRVLVILRQVSFHRRYLLLGCNYCCSESLLARQCKSVGHALAPVCARTFKTIYTTESGLKYFFCRWVVAVLLCCACSGHWTFASRFPTLIISHAASECRQYL